VQLTEQEAAQRVDRYFTELVAALPVTPRLELLKSGIKGWCAEPTTPHYGQYRQAVHACWLRDLPTDHADTFFNAAISYWLDHGFEIVHDNLLPGGSSENRAVVAHNVEDGFGMTLQYADTVGFSLSASSPCMRFAAQT
jgi:hypothetical protein